MPQMTLFAARREGDDSLPAVGEEIEILYDMQQARWLLARVVETSSGTLIAEFTGSAARDSDRHHWSGPTEPRYLQEGYGKWWRRPILANYR